MADWGFVIVWAIENADLVKVTLAVIGVGLICIAFGVLFWGLMR